MARDFDVDTAFARNLGWVTRPEQARLGRARIAIAGLGGVGGSHLLTLTRLGIGAFTIADFDRFDVANFNRQAGARVSTLNRAKVDVMAAMALDINPKLKLTCFSEGVTKENVHQFLSGVDLYIDGLDFFAFEARRLVFQVCAELGIPAVTAAPLGMGAAMLAFLPGHMTFEEYFRWDGCDETQMALRFLLGLAPAGLHRQYLVDPTSINLEERRGPSTVIGCEMCAAFAAGQALKILLGRGDVPAAPRVLQYDAYRNVLVRSWRPWGNHNPLQRVLLWLAERSVRPAQPHSAWRGFGLGFATAMLLALATAGFVSRGVTEPAPAALSSATVEPPAPPPSEVEPRSAEPPPVTDPPAASAPSAEPTLARRAGKAARRQPRHDLN